MTELPNTFLFMKVGPQANESWEQILEKKRQEYKEGGQILWGYGGATCHPVKIVQRLGREMVTPYVVMELLPPSDKPVEFAGRAAKLCSENNDEWELIPKCHKVTGFEFALVMGEIMAVDLELPLGKYEVAYGPSQGKEAERYIKSRSDKGCLTRSDRPRLSNDPPRKIHYIAELMEPFAVFLR